MRIQELGEFGLIERIRKVSGRYSGHPEILLGIGDDCAAVKYLKGGCLLFTTDTLVENIHFSKKYYSYYDIGYKVIAVNLSDIAAMGGIPQYCLVTLGLPHNLKVHEVDGIFRGINALCSEFDVKVIGGDIIKSPESLFISVTAIGKTATGSGIKRNGAKPGDIIFTTGTFGDSAAGFFILKKGIPGWGNLEKKHLRPVPRIKEGLFIANTKSANSMIDSSDGFDKSVRFICQESRVGCEIDLDKIPVSAEFKTFTSDFRLEFTPLKAGTSDLILFGGEEYELIFTAPESKKHLFEKHFSPVGKITKNKTIVYTDSKGKRINIKNCGFDHFTTRYL